MLVVEPRGEPLELSEQRVRGGRTPDPNARVDKPIRSRRLWVALETEFASEGLAGGWGEANSILKRPS